MGKSSKSEPLSRVLRAVMVVLVGFVVGFGTSGGLTAQAHDGQWNDTVWKSNAVHSHTGFDITWRFAPGFPTGNKRDRMQEAFATWTSVPDAVVAFTKLSDTTNSYNHTDCQQDWGYNGIFEGSVGDPPGFDILARTRKCIHSSTDPLLNVAIHKFNIVVDYTNSFHTGASNGPNTEHDFGGVAAHEVGHASGFQGEFADAWDICTGDPKATMCGEEVCCHIPYGYRSLEPHDVDGFKAKY